MSKKERVKVRITQRALHQRINRRLKQEGQQLRTNRSERWYTDLGWYYIIDVQRNAVEAGHINLEKLGRKLGVIQPWEELEAE